MQNLAALVVKSAPMEKTSFILALGILLAVFTTTPSAEHLSDKVNFPLVHPQHQHMQRLLENAMAYMNPQHGLVDADSGYLVEGWNHDPERGLYLRSFTQLTAIGEQAELLANIAAGYATNPYLSKQEALNQLQKMTASLLADQRDPGVSAKGLLGNFLGLESDRRIGPLREEVEKSRFVDAFGQNPANEIWNGLIARRWIIPQQDGSFAKIPRTGDYGHAFFTAELAPFAERNLSAKIMAVLDQRGVQIIFGDNANLTASIAKTIGALRHPSLNDDRLSQRIGLQLEQFIAQQEEGYRYLYDAQSGTFVFGWNATQNRFTGWEDDNRKWIVGHMDYFVNEFRGPLSFVVQRFNLPKDAVKNAGFKIKPYRMADGSDLYTVATWHGSAFQSLGLSLFMQELEIPGWRENLQNAVAIQLDFAAQHHLPGFLSEAYSGQGVEYTGDIGIADVAVTDHKRITDAPSLYTLGVAYTIAPEKIESFLSRHWKTISVLLTPHGPWEGYNTTQNRAIEFQTTAHTLALILGGIGSADDNMQRYLIGRGISPDSNLLDAKSDAFNFLSEQVLWIPWSPVNDVVNVQREGHGLRIHAESARNSAVTVKLPKETSLSNGALVLRYRAAKPIQARMTLNGAGKSFPNEIFIRLDATQDEKQIRIPMPGTPGLQSVTELVVWLGNLHQPEAVDCTISRFEFVP